MGWTMAEGRIEGGMADVGGARGLSACSGVRFVVQWRPPDDGRAET